MLKLQIPAEIDRTWSDQPTARGVLETAAGSKANQRHCKSDAAYAPTTRGLF